MPIWLSGLASKAWLYLVGALAAIAALATLYASIKRSGRNAQIVDDVAAVEKRNRMATQARIEAAKPPTPQEEANDPFNRDRR